MRAYATNSEGTAYGNEMSLTTFSGKRILLDTIQYDYVAKNGDTLVNTLSSPHKISIADGAIVILRDVTINRVDENAYDWAGITCEGDATIVLEGNNSVESFGAAYPGVFVPHGNTLTIQGAGSMEASSYGNGAGIGGGVGIDCGNIIVKGGTINATGGKYAAGIGSGYGSSCGSIYISGGMVTATGGRWAAGIGTGLAIDTSITCGDISISGGTVEAIGVDCGAGIGTGMSYDHSNECGAINISGGTVTATGGMSSAGIGSGFAYGASNTCGNIRISGGTVTATGVEKAAGIGTAKNSGSNSSICGTITIDSTVNILTVTKGNDAHNYIGLNRSDASYNSCGAVNIDTSLHVETDNDNHTRTYTHQ